MSIRSSSRTRWGVVNKKCKCLYLEFLSYDDRYANRFLERHDASWKYSTTFHKLLCSMQIQLPSKATLQHIGLTGFCNVTGYVWWWQIINCLPCCQYKRFHLEASLSCMLHMLAFLWWYEHINFKCIQILKLARLFKQIFNCQIRETKTLGQFYKTSLSMFIQK